MLKKIPKPSLKIAILIDQLVPGGIQKAAIEEAKHLQKMGNDITLVVLIKNNYQYQYRDLSKGLKIIFLSSLNPRFFQTPIKIPYFSFLTTLHILSPFFISRYKFFKKFDFIISHGTTTCITASAISRKLKIPYIAFIWDPMSYILQKIYKTKIPSLFYSIIRLAANHYESSFLKSAAVIATSSKVHQDFIKENYGVVPEIIYPGIAPASQRVNSKNGNFILGYTRWELAKNPALFIWLAKKIPKAKFLIAGSWTNPQKEKEFKKQVEKNNLQRRILFFSPVTSQDLKTIASQSLVWVHPHFEAFGMSGLEMAAYGLPIIIPKGSGVTEIFEHGKHGFFPKNGQKKDYLRYLKLIITNKKQARQMGTDASITAQKFTWEKHTESLNQLILNYQPQTKMVALFSSVVTTKATGGGDHFFIELARRIPFNIKMTIITPQIGLFHLKKAGITNKNLSYKIIGSTAFDNKENPILLFIAYLIRSLKTLLILLWQKDLQILYSPTDNLPDVLPAYLIHLLKPKAAWHTRLFHLIESPDKRTGNFFVNLGSYTLQRVSIQFLKSARSIMIDNTNLIQKLTSMGFKKEKVEVHLGGINLKAITGTKPQRSKASEGIFIGRLQAHKGIFEALEAWTQVTKVIATAKLNIIGYGSPTTVKEIKNFIRKKQITKNISLLGYIHEKGRIYEYLQSSRLLLFLDHEAGFGLVCAEAMAARLPVVAYNLPIFGSVYKKGFIATDMGNSQKIAQNIIKLLTNEKLRGKMGREAQSQASSLTWESSAKKFYTSIRRKK